MRVGFSESTDSVLGNSEIADSSIDWLWASMILMGPVWKLDERWPFRLWCCASVYPIWKLMKHGT